MKRWNSTDFMATTEHVIAFFLHHNLVLVYLEFSSAAIIKYKHNGLVIMQSRCMELHQGINGIEVKVGSFSMVVLLLGFLCT